MKFRGTVILVAISLLLGGFYFGYLRPRAEADKDAAAFQKRFFRADPQEIVAIKVENKEGSVDIVHGPQGWLIERPQRYRPDEGMITKLLDTIAAGRLSKMVGNAGELSQFGLDRPVLSLTLGTKTAMDVLLIGQKNPTDTGYYAYAESLGKIFLINKELPKELYLRLFDLREKKLYSGITPNEVGRIVITRQGEKIELAVSNDQWWMRSPLNVRGGDSEVRNLLEKLLQQKAEAFIPWGKKLADLPQRLRLQLFDLTGRSLSDSTVIYWGTSGEEGIVVHEAGTAEAARTRREFWELLQVEAGALMERTLFPIDLGSASRIAVTAVADNITVERSGRRWLKNGKSVNADSVQRIIDMLSGWKGARVIVSGEQPGKPQTVIEVTDRFGVKRVVVTDRDMTRQLAGTALSIQAAPSDIARKDVAYLLSTATALQGNVLVGTHEIDQFLGMMRALQ